MVLLFSVCACEEEDNLDPEGKWELTPSQIELPADNLSVVLATDQSVTFKWTEAISSAGYYITYDVVIDTLGSENFDTPILKVTSGNGGKDLGLEIADSTIDEALSLAGYPAGEVANLTWAVVANCLSKIEYTSQSLNVKRFTTEIIPTQLYISGTATEGGSDLSNAIPLKRLNGSSGELSNIFEVYTSLSAGNSYKFYSEKSLPAHQYGGSDGELIKSGTAITVGEDGQYRITVDLDTNTYSLFKIDKWSVVGSPIEGGWGGDIPLEYQGGGIWESSIELIDTGGFVFRANGDWAYLMKRVVGTQNNVIMESQAASQGLEFEDIPSEQTGKFIITLDLSADAYTYTMVKDQSVDTPISTPEQLFLFADGTKVYEFIKDGDTFNSVKYLALKSGVIYTLNSAEDGSGTSYTIDSNIGETDSPDGDKVSNSPKLSEGNGEISVSRDQIYLLNFDFKTTKLRWTYYNIKLFHWDDWDSRDEFLMTYVHPYTFTITVNLLANYEMKFNSPWDIEFGAENPTEMSGNMINKGGSNFTNITADGTYKVTIVVSDDYETGTYEFVKQ